MDGQSNVERLRRAYEEWRKTGGDGAVWHDLFADRILFGSIGNGAPGLEFSRARVTREEVMEYFAELGRDWEMIDYQPREFIAEGERVAMLGECSWRHRATGNVLTTPKADFWRFERGKAIDFYEFYDTLRASKACNC